MDKAREILQRWEAIGNSHRESRVEEARRDISYLVVELNVARSIIRQMAVARNPQEISAAQHAACGYLADSGETV